MGRAVALIQASWRTALSYRTRMVLSLLALLTTIVPVYFIANGLQPTMADAIRDQGEQYFGFLVVGLAAFAFLRATVRSLPQSLSGAIDSGTLEALLVTPLRTTELVAGLTGYRLLRTLAMAAVLLTAASLLGADFAAGNLATGAGVVALIVLAHLPFALVAAAAVLAFRTSLHIPTAIVILSQFLGGVYYPTQIVPSWLEGVSHLLPLTYGLRALRLSLLEGLPLSALYGDLFWLCALGAGLLVIGIGAWRLALGYARRSGSFAQY